MWGTFAESVEDVLNWANNAVNEALKVIKEIWEWLKTPFQGVDLERYIVEHPPAPVTVAGVEGFAYDPATIMMSSFAVGSESIPRDGYYPLHEEEKVFQDGDNSREAKSISITMGDFNVNINSTGDDVIDGERIGRIAMEYFNEQLSRVMT